MQQTQSAYGMSVDVALPYDQAVAKTRDALQSEGFGVLTEINVKDTLKQKLDVDFRPYIILGACNPPLAHRALSHERDIGLLLPCNVVVYAADQSGRSTVAAIDPVAQLGVTGNKDLVPVAEDVKQRLSRVLELVSAS